MSDLTQLKSHYVFDFVIVCEWLCVFVCVVCGVSTIAHDMEVSLIWVDAGLDCCTQP